MAVQVKSSHRFPPEYVPATIETACVQGCTVRRSGTGTVPRTEETYNRLSGDKENVASTSRSAGLTPERILFRAVEIVDADGIDGLTMRRLAHELGVGTMTLYGHFRTKEEILDGMADLILRQLPITKPGEEGPVQAVLHLAGAMRDVMRQHPSVVRLFSSRVISSPGALQGGFEAPLAVLRAAGFEGETAVRVFGALLAYTLGFTLYQLPRPWGPDAPDVGEHRRRRRAFYESLPADEFPQLVELAEPMTTLASEEQFEWGLRALLAGFDVRAVDRRRTRRA
jgi:AcrR family transcriptional regulator